MNSVCLIGRLARDPDVRYSNSQNGQICVARYTLAVDRFGAKEGQQSADFIQCAAFGKPGEFVEKYLKRGMKIGIKGRIQTGSYTDKNGNKAYSFEVVAEQHEFCEKKGEGGAAPQTQPQQGGYPTGPADRNGFIQVPDDVDDAGLPFN